MVSRRAKGALLNPRVPMSSLPEEIASDRLTLRLITPEDAERLIAALR